MGLFGLFKSKLEKESIGEKIVCANCGSEYYELKVFPVPSELSQKYNYEPGTQCVACGKFYCKNCSFGMMLCPCVEFNRSSKLGSIPLRCVKKRT